MKKVGDIVKNPLMKKSIIIAVTLLIIFSFLATLYTDYLSKHLYSETNQYLQEIAEQTATSVNNRMNENVTQLKTIALMIQSGNTNEDQLLDYLNKLAKDDHIKRFGIADMNGDVVTSDRKTFNVQNREYFQKSIKGESVKSNTFIDVVDGEQINVYSVPLYHQNGDIKGVLFATFDTIRLSSILDNASFNNEGFSFIFNEQGDIVLLSKQSSAIENITNIKHLSKDSSIRINDIQIDGSGILRYVNQQNEDNFFTYADIKNNDWLIASVFPEDAVTSKIQYLIRSAFVIWLFIAIASASLITYIYFLYNKNKLQITKLAFEDSLTNHYNFHQFIEYCQQKQHLEHYVLINCDIKSFKWFNEIYGEEIANHLLITIMHCIDKICHDYELCCREKDDHFAILLKKDSLSNIRERLFQLAHMIRFEFNKQYSTSQFYFHFGVYELHEDDLDIKTAFQKTQYVKNNHKELSQDDVTCYQEDAFQKELHAQQIDQAFQDSLTNQEYEVYIQPKYDLKTGSVYSGEGLVRWNHPTRGFITPDSFIPIFEKNGKLEELDVYVLKRVLITLERWRKEYHQNIHISINVSRTYLFNEGFIDQFIALVKEYDILPEQIGVEITETTALNHKEELIEILYKLKKHHMKISLDDFGSGYSSLNMLKDLPIDVVKIDQEFFRTNQHNQIRSHIIIEEVIELCHKLNIQVVAEGVETKEQSDFLKKHHCDYIQGYYYYKPMPINDFENLFLKEK